MYKKIMLTMAGLAAVGMIAQAADRDTPERQGSYVQVTAGAAIPSGVMVAILPATGLAYSAADTATMAVIGRAEKSAVSNDVLLVKRGVFRWDNYGAYTKASLGLTCYVSNSVSVQTASDAANDVPAGVIVDYDSIGVWVDTYNQKVTLTTSVTSLAVSGAATVGTTLAVTGASTLTGVATLTAAPKFAAVTAPGTATTTATNAPALTAATAPVWVTVTIGAYNYVVPAYKLQ